MWEVLIILLTYIANSVKQLQWGEGSGGSWEGQWWKLNIDDLLSSIFWLHK